MYLSNGTNWSMRSGKYSAMRVVLSKCLKLTLSLVELLPSVPQPSVSDAIRPVVEPMTPCEPGVFTSTRLAGMAAAKRSISSRFSV